MPLCCPQCGGAGLRITAALELPPDDRSDERTVQALECAGCGFTGLGVYEESRRGALDGETVNHTAFPADENAFAALERLINSCPNPKDSRCDCASHRRLDQALGGDESILPGIDWSRPRGIEWIR